MAASTTPQMGGAFDPTKDVNFSGAVDFGSSVPSVGSATVITTANTATLTSKTLTTPTIAFNVQAITSAGTTGTNATAVTISYPGLITVTGASGAGIAMATGTAVPGAIYFIKNLGTGATLVYAIGGTINGTTGTTALTVTVTGTSGFGLMCVAAGAWQTIPNPT